MEYELKTVNELRRSKPKIVVWDGETGAAAAWAYVRSHPGVAVVAWRVRRFPIQIGIPRIVNDG